jgi:hypothetical protein
VRSGIEPHCIPITTAQRKKHRLCLKGGVRAPLRALRRASPRMCAHRDTQRAGNIGAQRCTTFAIHFASVNQAQFEFFSPRHETRSRKKFFCARQNFFVAHARTGSLSIENFFAQPTRF